VMIDPRPTAADTPLRKTLMNPPPVVMFPTRKPLPPSRKKRSRVQAGGQLVTPPGQVWLCKVPDVGLGLADKNRSVRLLVFGDR